MITTEDIKNLADLARIEMAEGEAERLRESMEGILDYISEVREVSGGEAEKTLPAAALRNVFREDGEPHEAEKYTKGVLENASDKEGGYVKVKKIL